jgi:hypothetical protein
MNVVVYSKDMEPITVLDLPLEVLDKAASSGKVTIKVRGTRGYNSSHYGDRLCVLEYKELRAWDGGVVNVLITEHEETALIAKPGWLPGQRGQLNHYLNRIKTLLGQRGG